MERKFDSYCFTAKTEEELLEEVVEMESNSEWVPGVISKELRLEAIEAPIYAQDAAMRYNLDYELMADTAENTKLLLDYYGTKMMVRDTARSTLGETAKLYGSALGRMGTPLMAETLNNGLSVARGNSLLLMRYGKVSAVHSDAEGGYQIMPISSLMDIAWTALSRDFGEVEFQEGYNSHGYTSALWALPDAQDDILTAYQDALQGAVSHNFGINMMPAVKLMTSDTASSCARLIPVFLYRGTEFRLVEGVSVKHTKRYSINGMSGVDAFAAGAADIYACFKASAEVIAQLGKIPVKHGCNCVVSLCKRYDIPKKYGEAARLLVERFTIGGRIISAHDVFLCMNETVVEAKRLGAGWTQIINLQEAIAKVVNADWSAHDVGGTVTW